MARRRKKTVSEELRGLSDEELARKLEEAYRQLFTLRLKLSTRQLANHRELPKVRHQIARIKTFQRERELAAAWEAAQKEVS
ncbi:MAG: 50S ribosomal protein L29 [Dehalococcoidia bacterium]|jgi:large subunit ribosomal protein L29|nr:50S ribosomal protein L29 [Dehalococcoidia bacterium]